MKDRFVVRAACSLAVGAVVIAFGACGGGLSGHYADESGLIKFNFKPEHKVEIENPFGAGGVEFDYEIKDKALRIQMPQGTQVYPFLENGCFQVSFVAKVCKVKT